MSDIMSIVGNLGPDIEWPRYDEPMEVGAIVSRTPNSPPFYRVVAIDGEWAWARSVINGAYVTIYHPHFQRKDVIVNLNNARSEPASDLEQAA